MDLSIRTISAFYARAAWRYPRLVIGMLLSTPLTIIVNGVLPPLVVSHVLDRLSRRDFRSHHVWASFSSSILAYVGLVLLGGIVTWRVVDAFVWRLESNVERDLAQRSFKHLITESADFHSNTFGGSLVSNTSKLMGSYVRIQDTTLFQVYPLLITLVGVVVIMAPRALLFAVLLLLFSIAYMVVAVFISAGVRRAGAAHATAESAQTGALADAVTNVMAIKAFAREPHEVSRFAAATERTRRLVIEGLMPAQQRQGVAFGTITSGISSMAFVVAIYGVVTLDANIGTVFLILSYTTNLTQQLYQFSNNALRTYNRAYGDAAAMIAILAQTPAVLDPPDPQPLHVTGGRITFEDVTFAHAGGGSLFEGFSLDIAPGEKVGLVGHSGAGKTSFTRLLLRFSDVDGGRILLDGQDIAAVSQADLHAAIAYVPQEPLLFHRSITENVGYGRQTPTTGEVARAARSANAASFIETLQHGYETLVGERGVKLSGGQRQRIAIARAMLKDAPILLLDEATSALDSESEVLIQDALWRLMEGRTAVVIAHRLSTIQRLDRIVVLDEGRIAETGTHAELLANPDGIYASFWAHQSGSFSEV